MSSANCIALVPAGGSGQRFGLEKQFFPLSGHTVLWHAIQPLACAVQHIRVVVAADNIKQAQAALADSPGNITILPAGGDTRAMSVYNGLADIADDTWVLVHDAARPCLSQSACERLLEYTQTGSGDGAVLALPVHDALKRAANNRITAAVDRSDLWLMQTPQLFRAGLLRKQLPQYPAAADEAEAVLAGGGRVEVIMGERRNIKITYPDDIKLAAWLLNTESEQTA